MTYAEAIRIPDELITRYRSDPIFHNQVQRAVASSMQLMDDAVRAVLSAEGSR